MYLLLIYLLSSMKLQKGHEKLHGCRFRIMLPPWYFMQKVEISYGMVEYRSNWKVFSGKNGFCRIILFRDIIYNAIWKFAQAFSC